MSLDSINLDKAKVWRILDYEVQMFLGMGDIRAHLKIEGDNEELLVRNALVESSLLHIRILTDIFLSKGNHADDINLELLGFNSNSIEPILAEKLYALALAYGKANDQESNCWIINKRLAHPTTHRTKGYDYSTVFDSMDKPLKAIVEYIYGSAKKQLPFPLRL
jgi:hypothetical protein